MVIKATPKSPGLNIYADVTHGGLGAFLEVQIVFRVASAGVSTRCTIRDKRRCS